MIGIPSDINSPYHQWINEKLITVIKIDRTSPYVWITFVDGKEITFKFDSEEEQLAVIKKLTQESRV